MPTADSYFIEHQPFYQAQDNEIRLFEAAYAARLPVMLKGPTGCGKSRFVEYMAWRLGKPLITVACNEDMTAADLVGRYLLDATGTRWLDGPLTTAARLGAICYLDEIVEARKDVTVVIHPLADHRRTLPLERTGELLAAPPEFMLVVSYNPGYQNFLKGLKPSTRQRFVALRFGFPDEAREIRILQRETGCDALLARRLVALGNAIRRLDGVDLEEVASTRLLVYAALLIRGGLPVLAACRAALVEALSDDAEVTAGLEELVRTVLGE